MLKNHNDINSEISWIHWLPIGFIILSIRFVQGWIFWGGGSRRFFYDPGKLDPYSSEWMANKLQSAMPGALLGVDNLISFLLQHFTLLYIAIILFSLVELFCGLGLLLGLFTRLSGFITAMISVMLMLIFGWEGSACIDEWTMAVANFAMGLTLALSGSPRYSLDALLMHRYPNLVQKRWFLYSASGPWSLKVLKRASIFALIATVIFTLTTYNYYRGSIYSLYHKGPVSSTNHHLSLSEASINSNGKVNFILYIDGGSPAQPSYIMRIEFADSQQDVIESWEGKQLNPLTTNIQNIYSYNRIGFGHFGLIAPVSAKAKIELNPTNNLIKLVSGKYYLWIYTVDGKRWESSLIFS